MNSLRLVLVGLISTLCLSCTNVPVYDRVLLNAEGMSGDDETLDVFDKSSETYREGCSGGDGGKTGGGCGCN